MQLDIISDITPAEFAENYISKNQPVVVRGIPYEAEQWMPAALNISIGDLTAQVYGSLFDLENIQSAAEYMEDYFGNSDGDYEDDIPYIRWYNQLKDVDFAWGDEAFAAIQDFWQKPNCIPSDNMLVPLTQQDTQANPNIDRFPYRGLLIAARGARTRLHRDPFCTDAVVCQFHGVKEAALYHPDRAQELQADSDSSSFGGFTDVRGANLNSLSHEPDFHGEVRPGDMIYIPHGWLHDVLVVEDSVSVTWNFVHERGSKEYKQYLKNSPETDSEFEVLKYFYSLAGIQNATAQDILALAEETGSTVSA
ncbi:MAG: ribosomal protein L16 Arg81 hydroxylase [Granulosicoccus sp.]|jgi:ribosomal protein L16 Arg81 hydroxylase